MSTDVTHEPSRYVIHLDGRPIGRAEYIDTGDRRIFTHTEIDPALEGRGHGAELVRHALADTRAQGRQIVPQCSFVARVMRSS